MFKTTFLIGIALMAFGTWTLLVPTDQALADCVDRGGHLVHGLKARPVCEPPSERH